MAGYILYWRIRMDCFCLDFEVMMGLVSGGEGPSTFLGGKKREERAHPSPKTRGNASATVVPSILAEFLIDLLVICRPHTLVKFSQLCNLPWHKITSTPFNYVFFVLLSFHLLFFNIIGSSSAGLFKK